MSEKIYALLLRLYPARFRAKYADAAMELFRDRARDERDSSGNCDFGWTSWGIWLSRCREHTAVRGYLHPFQLSRYSRYLHFNCSKQAARAERRSFTQRCCLSPCLPLCLSGLAMGRS
jgi:hypothetical protein